MFGYTVAPDDADDNGIWIGDQDRTLVGDRRLTTQAGAITSTATGTAADLTHTELGRQDNHKVDGTRSIVSVAVTSTPQLETDTYGAGETIEFTVTFNVAVDVTGDPVLEFLLDGSEVRQASDVSGSGTTTLVFSYTVVSGDDDDNGLFIRDESDYNNPDGPVRLDSNDEIEFKDTSTDVPLYWAGRGTQSGHKVDGSQTTDNVAPSFTSSATFDAAENQTDVGTVLAADSDADDSVTGYAIAGGADMALFEIGATSGELAFKTAPGLRGPGHRQRPRGDGPGDQRHGHAGDDRGPDDHGDGDRRQRAIGHAGQADAGGGFGLVDEPDRDVDEAGAERRPGHHRLRRAVPRGRDGHVVELHQLRRDGDDGDHHRADGGHLLPGAGAGQERRDGQRLVGPLRRGEDQRGDGHPELHAEHRRPLVRRVDGGGYRQQRGRLRQRDGRPVGHDVLGGDQQLQDPPCECRRPHRDEPGGTCLQPGHGGPRRGRPGQAGAAYRRHHRHVRVQRGNANSLPPQMARHGPGLVLGDVRDAAAAPRAGGAGRGRRT